MHLQTIKGDSVSIVYHLPKMHQKKLSLAVLLVAVVCFPTATESLRTRMRREHVEWWTALLRDFQRQVAQAMSSVVESCGTAGTTYNSTLLPRYDQLIEMLQEFIQQNNSCCENTLLQVIEQTRSNNIYCNQLRELHQEELLRREHLGENWKYPAYFCSEIAERKPNSSSGLYWLQNYASSPPVQVYCDLEKEFLGSKGWMRVANLDMTDPNQQCPPNFKLYARDRLCGKSTDGNACDSVKYTTSGVRYSKVCGRVAGYQFGSPDGLRVCPTCTIDEPYVDGVSITHGDSPRKHIWTFAADNIEIGNYCPCSSPTAIQPSSFVGNDYYCESGLLRYPWDVVLYSDDVLWDGKRCDANEAPCCDRPLLPWFCKELPEPTSDDLEVRICADSGLHDEDVPVEKIELYVQ